MLRFTNAEDDFSALITNVAARSGRSYKVTRLSEGARLYPDRNYNVTSVPVGFAGAALLQTANDDKRNTSATLLTFDLSEPATVYVAYNKQATTLPSWLLGWTELTYKLGVLDPKATSMTMYSKSYPAGRVTLGGNLARPAAGAVKNYVVMALPRKRDPATQELMVYPNPNLGRRINVELRNFGRKEKVTVTVHALSGSRLHSFDLYTNSEGAENFPLVFTPALKQGMYLLQAGAASGKASARLLVIR